MQDPKKSPKIAIWAPSHNFVRLYLRNYGTYRQSEKNLLSSNISPTRSHNMANFGPLAAEILSLVWGTPGNFNWFRVLAALLHGTLVVGVSQTAALNRGRHLCSTGRPSRWILAHISSLSRVLRGLRCWHVDKLLSIILTISSFRGRTQGVYIYIRDLYPQNCQNLT